MNSFLAAIEKDTNRFVSSSKSSWNYISINNFFRAKGDNNFYEVVKVNEFCYNQEFTVLDRNTIKLETDVGANLLIGDEVNLVYSIHEFVTVFSVSSPGSGYKKGDILKLDLADSIKDSYTGEENYTSFTVTEVNETGGITKFNINKKGSYFDEPPEKCFLVGGHGKDASFRCLFQSKISKNLLERDISHIERNVPSIITFNISIPEGIKKGNLFVNKWELFVPANHSESRYDVQYEVIKDFTPNYRLPLLLPNSFSREIIYNRSISILDTKIAELENRIKLLEKS